MNVIGSRLKHYYQVMVYRLGMKLVAKYGSLPLSSSIFCPFSDQSWPYFPWLGVWPDLVVMKVDLGRRLLEPEIRA